MSRPHEELQAILRHFQEPLDRAMLALQGELGALVARLEEEGSEEEYYVLGIYNDAYDRRLQVKSFFETWLDK